MAEKYGSTPESLLEDTVLFVKDMLSELKKAEPMASKANFPHLRTISLQWVQPEMSEDTIEFLKEKNTIVYRQCVADESKIIDAGYNRCLTKIIAGSGLRDYRSVNLMGRGMDADDFAIGGSRGMKSVYSVGIVFTEGNGNAEKIFKALDIDDQKLRQLCLQSLREEFAYFAAFQRQMRQNGLDMVTAGDAAEFAAELKTRGLPGPDVVDVGSKKPPVTLTAKKLH